MSIEYDLARARLGIGEFDYCKHCKWLDRAFKRPPRGSWYCTHPSSSEHHPFHASGKTDEESARERLGLGWKWYATNRGEPGGLGYMDQCGPEARYFEVKDE